MKADCHVHFVLDGADFRRAIARNAAAPDMEMIREHLAACQKAGCTFLRSGGDKWGVGLAAARIAPEYGIDLRTPAFPICRKGNYGGFIGKSYETMKDYAALVAEVRRSGGSFVKIMIAGIMDFDRFGVLSQPGLPGGEIRELIHIAHGEGFSVMAHANGAETVEAACTAGVDSVEHGAYLDGDAVAALAQSGAVWVPTLAAIGNLRGKGRFREDAVERILESALENVEKCAAMGGYLAPGSDAGAWAVPHGQGMEDEYALLRSVLGDRTEEVLNRGIGRIRAKF